MYKLTMNIRDTIKKQPKYLVILIIITCLIVGIFLWIYNHSYINVVLSNARPNSSITFHIVNQQTKKSIMATSTSNTLKKLVPKGDYEVIVTQGESSFFSSIKTSSLLKTTSVSGEFFKENSREFIGNNPGPCMFYDRVVLYSYSCSGDASDLTIHVPANNTTPTITKSLENAPLYPIDGATTSSGHTKLLLEDTSIDESIPTKSLYTIDSNYQLADRMELRGISDANSYGIKNFDGGLLVYSSDYSKVLYYKDVQSDPKILSLPKPRRKNFIATALSSYGTKVAIIYSTHDQREDINQDQSRINTGKTIVEVYDTATKQSSEFTYNTGFTHLILCGDRQLCLVNGRDLTVYDTHTQEATPLYKLTDVQDLFMDGDTLVIVKPSGIFGINPSTGKGYQQYRFGEYKYCAASAVAQGGYIVCLINPDNDRVAIYVNTHNEDVSQIDKKVLKLQNSSLIDSVSIYKNYLYISPHIKKQIYNPAIRGYTYDPSEVQRVNNSINTLVHRSGIDASKYDVINPYAN